jgi:cytochrome c2
MITQSAVTITDIVFPIRPIVGGLAFIALALAAGCNQPGSVSLPFAGDAKAGQRAIAELGCGVCHVVPGVAGARGNVGPSLEGFARGTYIAGSIPNEPEALLRWILDPPSLIPATAMPRMPMSEAQARDIVAYLRTLH